MADSQALVSQKASPMRCDATLKSRSLLCWMTAPIVVLLCLLTPPLTRAQPTETPIEGPATDQSSGLDSGSQRSMSRPEPGDNIGFKLVRTSEGEATGPVTDRGSDRSHRVSVASGDSDGGSAIEAGESEMRITYSIEEIRQHAEEGIVEAQWLLGYKYYHGVEVPEDLGLAVKWFRKGARKGYARAQRALGEMYENGMGVEQSHRKALGWYLKAAKQGERRAQVSVAMIYSHGMPDGDSDRRNWPRFGVRLDDAEALKWFRPAAEDGHTMASYRLGVMFDRGLGTESDQAEAGRWYLKAADQDYPPAQIEIGRRYRDGHGVVTDLVRAHMWLSIAGKDELYAVEQELASVAKAMTPEQIAEAERLASEWEPKPDF